MKKTVRADTAQTLTEVLMGCAHISKMARIKIVQWTGKRREAPPLMIWQYSGGSSSGWRWWGNPPASCPIKELAQMVAKVGAD